MRDTFNSIVFSDHFYDRAWERLHASRDEAASLAYRAVRNGKIIEDYSGSQRKYLERKRANVDSWHTVFYILSNLCFVFTDTGVLKTVFSLEKAFFKLNRPKAPRFNGDDIYVAVELLLKMPKCFYNVIFVPFIIKTYICH